MQPGTKSTSNSPWDSPVQVPKLKSGRFQMMKRRVEDQEDTIGGTMKKQIVFCITTFLVILLCGIGHATGAEARSEKDAIMRASLKDCQPKWCKPEVQKIVDGYASVLFKCKKKNCENAIGYFKKTGNTWKLVDQGTGITPDDLKEYGFPAHIAKKLAGN